MASRGKIIRFAQYVTDPTSRDSVDDAVRTVNGLLSESTTVDLTGTWLWPTVSFNTGQHKNVQYIGGDYSQGNETTYRHFSGVTTVVGGEPQVDEFLYGMGRLYEDSVLWEDSELYTLEV